MRRILRDKVYKTRDQHLIDLENQFLDLVGLEDSKKQEGRVLLNQIVQELILETDDLLKNLKLDSAWQREVTLFVYNKT